MRMLAVSSSMRGWAVTCWPAEGDRHGLQGQQEMDGLLDRDPGPMLQVASHGERPKAARAPKALSQWG
ncbi:MAG: hypothetical protein LBU38_02480 [Propionibacteriaceae bacterium]|nr:hypothetical protein [Propionibacteriaceae bacterium]